MATPIHKVTATLIVVKHDGTESYLRQGKVLPEGVSAGERKRLVGLGLVELFRPPSASELKASADAASKVQAASDAAEAERLKQADAEEAERVRLEAEAAKK